MNAILCDRCGIITTNRASHYSVVFKSRMSSFELCPDCAEALKYFVFKCDDHNKNLGKTWESKEE